MRLAKIFWIFGSIGIGFAILTFLMLSSKAPLEPEMRHQYLNNNWAIFGTYWKVEFLLMTLITIGAVYFAINLRKMGWAIVTIGQLLLLSMYPLILGGYRNTSFEVYEMANQMAITIFLFGNIVFIGGVLHLCVMEKVLKNWLRFTAIGICVISLTAFLAAFSGLVEWKKAMIVGPLLIILYFINAYLGMKLKLPGNDFLKIVSTRD